MRSASAGVVSAIGMGTAAAAQTVRANPNLAADPGPPPGLGKNAVPDNRFALTYQSPVAEAARVMMDHLAALGRRDIRGVADTLHFPFAIFEGTDIIEVPTREAFIANAPASFNMTNTPKRHSKLDGYMKPGTYDVFHAFEVLITTPNNCAVAMTYDRYDNLGKKLLRCEGLYSVTNNDGRWAVQAASTIFTPADMIGTQFEDARREAKRLRIDHTLSAGTGDESFDRSGIRYGKTLSVRGTASWTAQVKGQQAVMDSYKVKGVKNRLAISNVTKDTPLRGERGTYQEYWDGMGTLGLGPWGFIYGTWPEGRVIHATADKAHVLAAAVRYTAAGEEMSLAVQACVATYREAKWALDGNLCYATLHDRANDIHPGGLNPV